MLFRSVPDGLHLLLLHPMRSERIASLSRYVMIDALNPAITSATQWFERTLDDSANKRLSVPEGFLAIDGILDPLFSEDLPDSD